MGLRALAVLCVAALLVVCVAADTKNKVTGLPGANANIVCIIGLRMQNSGTMQPNAGMFAEHLT